MKKRLLSLFLTMAMALVFLPQIPAQAASADVLPEKTGVSLILSAGETKTYSFTPGSDGLYVFSFVCVDYMDDQSFGSSEDYNFSIVDSSGSRLECIYIVGWEDNYPNWDDRFAATSTNDYVARLQKGSTYTLQYKNPKSEADELVVVASPLKTSDGSGISPIAIPGYGDGGKNTYEYVDASGKLKSSTTTYTNTLKSRIVMIKIDRDGWYSLGTGSQDLSEFGGYGIMYFYTSELQPMTAISYAMNHSKTENNVPASIYLAAGEYVIEVSELGLLGDGDIFAGTISSFANINTGSSIEVVTCNSWDAGATFVTFTPTVTGSYTFSARIYDNGLNNLWLYGADGKGIPECIKSHYLDENSFGIGKLTGTLTAGTTYYLGISGYGWCEVSVTAAAAPAWYDEAVNFVMERGLMNGVGNSDFAPNANLTRAMLAQIFYNKENQPAVTSGSNFTDVSADVWYADAISWAVAQSIVTGYGDGRFGPNDNITREQIAVMLWRYAGEPASSNEITFSDAAQISAYAQTAIRWAVEKGILNGKGNNILDPQGFATRAEVAQLLKNYLE